jgi:hypothetical protein
MQVRRGWVVEAVDAGTMRIFRGEWKLIVLITSIRLLNGWPVAVRVRPS